MSPFPSQDIAGSSANTTRRASPTSRAFPSASVPKSAFGMLTHGKVFVFPRDHSFALSTLMSTTPFLAIPIIRTSPQCAAVMVTLANISLHHPFASKVFTKHEI